MIRTLVLLAAVTLAASLAAGDTIYLRDKTVDGKVTRDGDKVVIELSTGGKLEVKPEDIIYVHSTESIAASASAPADATSPQPTATAASSPAAPIAISSAPVGGPSTIDIAAVTMPESMVFSTMRNLAAAPVGPQTFELRKQLEQWRAAVHDRKRKIGENWVVPKDFDLARDAFDQTLKDAQEMARKAKSGKTLTPAALRDAMAPVHAKVRMAATAWRDPMLKLFLIAVADYQSDSFLPAYNQSQQLHKDYPYIAAFAQCEAMSLIDLDRASDSLPAAMDFLRLRSDSAEAYDLLKLAMKKVPGVDTRGQPFLAAKDLLDQYQITSTTPNTNKTTNWLMPGKYWTSRDDTTLPVPPYDRLMVRQAVAVPVADNALLVDASAVSDSLEVLVRLDSRTVVQATVKKLTTSSKAPPVPLAMVTLNSHTFSVPARDEGADAWKDKDVSVYGIGVWPELGATLRQGRVKLRLGDDGGIRLGSTLMPGEATAPVLSQSGQIIGFVTGRTDVQAENGGDEKFIPFTDVAPLLKTAKTGYSSFGYGKVKRTGAPTAVKGQAFIVYGLFGEKLTDK